MSFFQVRLPSEATLDVFEFRASTLAATPLLAADARGSAIILFSIGVNKVRVPLLHAEALSIFCSMTLLSFVGHCFIRLGVLLDAAAQVVICLVYSCPSLINASTFAHSEILLRHLEGSFCAPVSVLAWIFHPERINRPSTFRINCLQLLFLM